MTTYAIKDWDQTFENRLSRRLDTLRYVSITNKQDSGAFVQLMRTPSGIIAYGVFIALVQIGSKCPERGTLTDDKGDWTPARFAKRFGTPAKVVETAFDLLMSAEIGWLVDAKTVQPAHTARTPRAQDAHTERTPGAQGAQPTGGGIVEYGNVRDGIVRERARAQELDNVPGAVPMPGDVPEFKPIADAHPKAAGWRKSVDAMREVWPSIYHHHGGEGTEDERIKRGLAWMMQTTLAYAKAVEGQGTRFLPACDRFWSEGIYETPAAWSNSNGQDNQRNSGSRQQASGRAGDRASRTTAAEERAKREFPEPPIEDILAQLVYRPPGTSGSASAAV
jgi:hypothetical protein